MKKTFSVQVLVLVLVVAVVFAACRWWRFCCFERPRAGKVFNGNFCRDFCLIGRERGSDHRGP